MCKTKRTHAIGRGSRRVAFERASRWATRVAPLLGPEHRQAIVEDSWPGLLPVERDLIAQAAGYAAGDTAREG